MVDNYLERHRKRNDDSAAGQSSTGTDWIGKSINKVPIHKSVVNINTGKLTISPDSMTAVHIFKEKEGPDNGILYTYTADGLKCGDLIVKNVEQVDLQDLAPKQVYMLYEESPRVDSSAFISVFTTLETNAIICIDTATYIAGYFMGRMKKLIGLDYRNEANIASADQDASLIVSKDVKIYPATIIRGVKSFFDTEYPQYSWQVQDIDLTSSSTMQYVTISKTLSVPFTPIPEPEEEGVVNKTTLQAGQTLEVVTASGYITTNPSAMIIKKTASRITLEVPLIPGNFSIITKNSDGELITTEYLIEI